MAPPAACSAPSSSSRARRSKSIALARWSWRKLSSSFGPGRRCSQTPFWLLERVTERADKPSVGHLRVASRLGPTETKPCARHPEPLVASPPPQRITREVEPLLARMRRIRDGRAGRGQAQVFEDLLDRGALGQKSEHCHAATGSGPESCFPQLRRSN